MAESKSKNSALHHAKEAKADEFYTQLVDIEKELMHYTKEFEGKVVFCNCDDPYLSLKELVSTGKDIITILPNNVFTYVNINSVCVLGGVV